MFLKVKKKQHHSLLASYLTDPFSGKITPKRNEDEYKTAQTEPGFAI